MKDLFKQIRIMNSMAGIYLILFALILFIFPEILSYLVASLALFAGIAILANSLRQRRRPKYGSRSEEYVIYEEWRGQDWPR